jgi:DNA primase
VKIIRLPKGHDPDSFIKEFGAAAFEKEIAGAKSLFDYKLGVLKLAYDSRSLEGKVKIANEMVRLFSKVQNEIQRAAWVRELAKELNVSEDALNAELKKSGGKAKIEITEAPQTVRKDYAPLERLLLGLWLEHPSYLEKSKQDVEPGDFRNEKTKLIANRLLSGGYLSVRDIMNEFKEDAEAIEILSAATAEMEKEGSKDQILSDCLFQVRENRLQERGKNIRTKELPEAERTGNKKLRNELLLELTNISRQQEEEKKKKPFIR